MDKIILLFLLLCCTSIFGQSPTDSLYSIWNDESQTDTARLDALNEYLYAFRPPLETRLSLAIEMNELAKKIGSKRYQVDAAIQECRAYLFMGALEKALEPGINGVKLAKEIGYHNGEARALGVVGAFYQFQGDPLQSIEYNTAAYEVAKKAQANSPNSVLFGDIKSWPLKDNIIDGYNNKVGDIYFRMAAYPKALEHFELAIKDYLILGNELMVAAVQNNIAMVHMEVQEYDKAMQYYQEALPVFEAHDHKEYQANVYGNMGTIYLNKKSYEGAENYLKRNLQIRKEIKGDPKLLGRSYGSLATLNLNIEKYEKALAYVDSAEVIFSSVDAKMDMIYTDMYRGDIYMKQGRLRESLQFFEKSLEQATNMQALSLEKDAIFYLYTAHKKAGQISKALSYHERLIALNDSLNKDETGKKLLQVEFSKKFLADSLLQADEKMRVQSVYEKEILKETNARNLFIAFGIMLLIISGGLWNRLNFSRKSNKIIQKEKDRSENLLLNILPAEVAEELKATGKAEAKDFELVSIIFTDFKKFTEISEKLSANELVQEINCCFEAFDAITEKYGVEKIKTIGDSYMAAGGLPISRDDSTKNTVSAALEMQQFIINRKAQQDTLGLIAFEMRVGINSGPIVAGIVGVKKFQYDIWGDTVNTASRMESSGEVGQVNISQQTYDLIKDEPEFTFTKRRKIKVKGKGDQDMYYVESANEQFI